MRRQIYTESVEIHIRVYVSEIFRRTLRAIRYILYIDGFDRWCLLKLEKKSIYTIAVVCEYILLSYSM